MQIERIDPVLAMAAMEVAFDMVPNLRKACKERRLERTHLDSLVHLGILPSEALDKVDAHFDNDVLHGLICDIAILLYPNNETCTE